MGSSQQGGELSVSQVGQEGFKEGNVSIFHDREMQYGDHLFPY